MSIKKKQISYSDTDRFSKIIIDYLSKKESLKPFYNKFLSIQNLQNQAQNKVKLFSESNRKALVNTLNAQYKNFETTSAVKENLEKLSKKNSVTVTTGHQLNLMTGPLYFIIKIISTINIVEKLNSLNKEINFIPVYWMASEDHDFDEISSFNYKSDKINWQTNQTGPVGKMNLDELKPVLDFFEKKLNDSKNSQEIKELIKLSYRSSKNLAEATLKIVNSLFGKYGLIIIDADSKSLKNIFKAYMKSEIINNNCHDQVNTQIETLKKEYNSKFKPQVNPRLINLFYLNKGGRYRIQKKKNQFVLIGSDKKFSENDLINEVENFPENFSPNVLMRPLFQEIILPNIAYVGGGAELSYWFQLNKYFKNQKVTFPILILRNSLLLINSKLSNKINKLNININDLFINKNLLISKVIKENSKISLDLDFLKKQLELQFDFLEDLVKKTDKSFNGAVLAQKKKQIKGIINLEKKLLKSQKIKMDDYVQRTNLIYESIFPNSDLQERQLNFFELYESEGVVILSNLKKAVDPFNDNFTILNY
ncbi:MAG: bacillithiol biosynthesis cysteine-adding enzyme BshC [Flavobacteriaceae bacterium]